VVAAAAHTVTIETSASDGTILKTSTNLTTAHNSQTGSVTLGDKVEVGQAYADPFYEVLRGYLYFAVDIPSDATITSAFLSVTIADFQNPAASDNVILQRGVTDALPHDPPIGTDFGSGNYTGDLGRADFTGWAIGSSYEIPLNQDGLDYLAGRNSVRLVLRSGQDIDNIAPDGLCWIEFESNETAAPVTLTINYTTELYSQYIGVRALLGIMPLLIFLGVLLGSGVVGITGIRMVRNSGDIQGYLLLGISLVMIAFCFIIFGSIILPAIGI